MEREKKTSIERALAAIVLHPVLGTLLISGKTGTGKSSQTREKLKEWGVAYQTIPLHMQEENFFPTVDLEKTLAEGKRIYGHSFFEKAPNYLYVDDIHLLSSSLLQKILQEKSNLEKPIALIGTINPEEEQFSIAELERFALFVDMEDPSLEERVAIMRAQLAHEKEVGRYTAERIAGARELLFDITVSKAMLLLAITFAQKAGTKGQNAEYYLIETAKAFAALDGDRFVLPKHMEEAALYVLPHRMYQNEEEQPRENEMEDTPPEENPKENNSDESRDEGPEEEIDDESSPEENDDEENSREEESHSNQELENDSEPQEEGEGDDSRENSLMPPMKPEQVAAIDRALYDLQLAKNRILDRFFRKGTGKRRLTKTTMLTGRYIKAQKSKGKIRDIAVDATIRAAAPYQHMRRIQYGDKKGLYIEKDDIREKIREKRVGRKIIFLVDASGSMAAKKRMKAVKSAIFSLLQDAYEKRDMVSLIAFRRKDAEVVLPMTNSVTLAQRQLANLPTGGTTPLGKGLEKAAFMVAQILQKDAHEEPILVIVTDGRATYSESDNAVEEIREWSQKLKSMAMVPIVFDTEKEFISLGIAKMMAEEMGAQYIKLDSITEHMIIDTLQS